MELIADLPAGLCEAFVPARGVSPVDGLNPRGNDAAEVKIVNLVPEFGRQVEEGCLRCLLSHDAADGSAMVD